MKLETPRQLMYIKSTLVQRIRYEYSNVQSVYTKSFKISQYLSLRSWSSPFVTKRSFRLKSISILTDPWHCVYPVSKHAIVRHRGFSVSLYLSCHELSQKNNTSFRGCCSRHLIAAWMRLTIPSPSPQILFHQQAGFTRWSSSFPKVTSICRALRWCVMQ